MLSKEHGVIVGVAILLDNWLYGPERRPYPVGLWIGLAIVTAGFLAAWPAIGRAGALAALGVLALACGGRSIARLPAWRDNRSQLLTLLAEHPESYRAHASAAAVLAGLHDTAGARREYHVADSLFAGGSACGRRARPLYCSAWATRPLLRRCCAERGPPCPMSGSRCGRNSCLIWLAETAPGRSRWPIPPGVGIRGRKAGTFRIRNELRNSCVQRGNLQKAGVQAPFGGPENLIGNQLNRFGTMT